jgi:superfamily II DNA or RNA helicase
MPNLVEVNYEQTGESKSTNEFGMRDMQEKAYEQRDAKYLLLKAPPASGKSRALMFIALDKLINQGVKKVIVAVPERSIGGSFGTTDLKSYGFYSDWDINEKYNLCTTSDSKSKVQAFKDFLDSDEKILICTHATLRFAFEQLNESKFNNTLLAIDEFHHVSADGENKLGEVLRNLIEKSSVHIVAMTGSYFRGDSVPVLLPEDEAKFTKVTYNYYEQLNGYEYLKSLGIGYHFYQGRYTTALDEILDTDKKTILHIPNVNSGESTKDKHREVGTILDIIGRVKEITEDGVIILQRHTDGKLLKVADLVNDDQKERDKIITYLRNITSVDDMDLIIALGMAKEGFDWPYCEHALTVGYRSSLTEIIQIIGRATRDSENKTTAQFTNLIAQPDANNDEVKLSVNNMLKAITSSLLMEQVLAPSFKFKPRFPDDKEPPKKGELKIRGYKKIKSEKVKEIIVQDLNDLKASILQDKDMIGAMPGDIDPLTIKDVLIPKIVKVKYPELSDDEVKELSQYAFVDSVIRNAVFETNGDKKFIRMGYPLPTLREQKLLVVKNEPKIIKNI